MSTSNSKSPGIPVLSARGKRKLPAVPNTWGQNGTVEGQKHRVKFNSETVETSIGGTQSTGKTKKGSDTQRFSLDKSNTSNDSLSTNESNTSQVSNDTVSISSQSGDNLEQHSVSGLNNDTKYNEENFITPVKEARKTLEMDNRLQGPLDYLSTFDAFTPSKQTPKRRYTFGDKLLSTPECYNAVQMDIPRYEFNYDDDYDNQGEDSCSVMVAVRVRPFSQRELKDANVRCVVSMRDNETTVMNDHGYRYNFAYDFSFWSFDEKIGNFSDQETVYKLLAQPLLGKAFEGYNTCLFAYGQTGSGKSYSIMGHGEEIGIIPRFCEELFSRADHEVTRDSEMVKINVEISFFEIYNEKIHDLLASSKEKGRKSTLKVREHPVLGPYVEGLSTYVVNSFEDVESWITLGNKNRATAATGMNDKSSRSHSVFTLVLTQTRTEEIESHQHEHCITSKINLVDLAGSERQSQAQTSGERLREGANINKSLLTLGKVISSLSDMSISRKRKTFIPYRDSVLTWLLKESLGGNSKTAMLATISPSHHHTEETLSTLRYAKQARTIVNTARVNEDPNTKLIKELRAEIERLKAAEFGFKDEEQSATLAEIAHLREQCLVREKEMEEMKQSWEQKLKKSEERKAQENKNLEKSGITCKVDNKMPNLVNLNEDPQLSEMLLYVIKEGQTRVGRMCPNSKHEIQLNGALIAENHCIINNLEDVISITPIGDAQTFVNGNLISEPVILQHGDRVILGGDHYFRFNHPKQVKNKNIPGSGQEVKKDFEFANQELLNVQEKRLQTELEEARRKAQEEMLVEVEKVKREALEEQRADFEDKLAKYEKLLKNQTVEVQMAAQGRMEADDTIQKLKKQKMLLEQELIVGRKRQQLEARAAEKAMMSPPSTKGSRLIELLETEKQKVSQRIVEFRQKRSDISSPTRRAAIMDNQLGRRDLYKIALLLREANKISQLLKKNMTFSREDYYEDDKVATAIKVTNDKLGLCTFWDVPKFEDKLAQMRDLYQNDCDSCSADDEVFNDPSDSWQQELPATPSTPRSSLGNSFSKSPIRQFLLSSCSVASPRGIRDENCSCQSNLNGSSLSKMCESVTLMFVNSIQDGYFEESMADKIIKCCQALNRSLLYLMDSSQDKETETNSEKIQHNLLKLATNIQTLSSHCTVWSNMYIEDRRQSNVLEDLTCKLKEQVKLMGNHMVMFFQGWGNDIESLICESGSNVIDSVLTVCKLTGEMVLATNMNMLCFDQLNCEDQSKNELSTDICQSFLSGCDLLIDKSLQGAIKTLEEWECKAQNLADLSNNNLSLGEIPQHVEEMVSSMKVLFSLCQEIQVEVDTSIRESCGGIPLQFYSVSYKRSQGLIRHISNLWETVGLLLDSAEPIIKGQSLDYRKLYKYSELIQKDISKLVMVSNKENFRLDSSSSDSDSSVLSDLQMQQLESAARDVHLSASSLVQQAEKLLQTEKVLMTPRAKRLLPASPEKAFNFTLKPSGIVLDS